MSDIAVPPEPVGVCAFLRCPGPGVLFVLVAVVTPMTPALGSPTYVRVEATDSCDIRCLRAYSCICLVAVVTPVEARKTERKERRERERKDL